MKRNIIFSIVTVFCAVIFSNAQDEVIIPFSNPSEAKKLDIQIFSGDVTIKGTNRNDVLVKYAIEKKNDDSEKPVPDKAKGMKKIGGGNVDFEVSESNNTARISSSSLGNLLYHVKLEIEVPYEIELELSKQVGRDINVENIRGDINIEASMGSINMTGISGNVNASSGVGGINVEFDQIPNPKPMTFTALSGDVEITIPKSHDAMFKMRTEWGEVYSDIDFTIENVIGDEEAEENDDKGLQLITKKWTNAIMNQGGEEIRVKTRMGNIYVRGI